MLEELEKKLYLEIPMTKYMQLKFEKIDKEYLYTTAPLLPNINDKGTGFAGSLSTLVTISAWSLCYLEAKKLGFDKCMIAIIKSDISYRAPITKDMICKTKIFSQEQLQLLKKKLEEKRSGSIKVEATILEDEKTCVEFKGIYIIKLL